MKPQTTLEILRIKPLAQLKADYVRDMTKRDLLVLANGGSEQIYDIPVCTYRRDGQIESQSETVRDVETDAVISTKTIAWTYYKTGEVDTITIAEMNADGKETGKKVIKHYTDGRQPEVKK